MKAQTDKQLEELVANLMQEKVLDTPSANFTANVMQRLPEKSAATVYKPLISKKGWFLVGAGILLVLTWLFVDPSDQTSNWGQQIGLHEINYNFLNRLAGVRVSAITLNIIAIAALMLLIQLVIIRNYLIRRLKT